MPESGRLGDADPAARLAVLPRARDPRLRPRERVAVALLDAGPVLHRLGRVPLEAVLCLILDGRGDHPLAFHPAGGPLLPRIVDGTPEQLGRLASLLRGIEAFRPVCGAPVREPPERRITRWLVTTPAVFFIASPMPCRQGREAVQQWCTSDSNE